MELREGSAPTAHLNATRAMRFSKLAFEVAFNAIARLRDFRTIASPTQEKS